MKKFVNKLLFKLGGFLLDLSTRRDPELAGRTAWLRANLRPKNFVKGEEHPAAKLNWEKVEAIRARYAMGGISHETLAREYGVSQKTVGNIVRHRIWKSKGSSHA